MLHRFVFLLSWICLLNPKADGQTLTVWPGDANNNGVVNNVDFLHLGLAYNFFGPARDSVGVNWQGAAAYPWAFSFANGANFVHADCNGDGIVQYTPDAFPIYVYYGRTHGTVSPDVFVAGNQGVDPQIFLDSTALPQQIYGGQALSIPLDFGTATLPVEDLYGLAFCVVVDPEFVDIDALAVKFNELSWANPDGDRIFSSYRVSPTQLDVAWVRTDHNNKSGFGRIGKLDFIVIDDVLDYQKTFQIRIQKIKMLDKFGNETLIAGDTLDITVLPDVLADDDPVREQYIFEVTPNPASDRLQITASEKIERVVLYNAFGQKTIETAPATHRLDLDLPDLPTGIYYLEAHTGSRIFIEKVQIQH